MGSNLETKRNGEIIYNGRIFTVIKDKVKTESGRKTTREIIKHPGSVAIVPIIDKSKVIMIEQFRYATGETLVEIPAGTIEPDESPEECAERELLEETGYSAEEFHLLSSCYTAPGYSNEIISIYLATKLNKIKDEPKEEGIHISIRGFDEAIKSISKEIIDAKSIIGLVLANRHIKSR